MLLCASGRHMHAIVCVWQALIFMRTCPKFMSELSTVPPPLLLNSTPTPITTTHATRLCKRALAHSHAHMPLCRHIHSCTQVADTLTDGCKEICTNTSIRRLLEIVLVVGNKLNRSTRSRACPPAYACMCAHLHVGTCTR